MAASSDAKVSIIVIYRYVALLYLFLGVIFVALGALFYSAADGVVEKKYSYEHSDSDAYVSEETFDVSIDKDMEGPVYVYYELSNFYQNHRRYVASRSDDQLAGDSINEAGDHDDCDPYITDDNDSVYYPCGLVARSYFTDIIRVYTISSDFTLDLVDMDESADAIAWDSDAEEKFKEPDDLENTDNITRLVIPTITELDDGTFDIGEENLSVENPHFSSENSTVSYTMDYPLVPRLE